MIAVNPDFFASDEVVHHARALLGMELWVDGLHGHRRGIITETEAYAGITDRASHAFGGKITKRNAVMYGKAGCIYMYICYGMHWMLNIVTAPEGIPHAVLIRSIRLFEPASKPVDVACGPGKLTRWLGIDGGFNGESIASARFGLHYNPDFKGEVVQSARIGIAYAGADALLPYRFYLAAERAVSKPLQPNYPENKDGRENKI
jgi:DNA-3-methyladenine glycosylase